MTRLALALTILATPSLADTRCEWGPSGTSVTIAPHETAAAQVVIDNRLAFRSREENCTITLDGMEVEVEYQANRHTEPDVFIVTPPEGYFASPDWLVVDDGAGAVVLIYPMGAVGM
jgi:hypothetical protein